MQYPSDSRNLSLSEPVMPGVRQRSRPWWIKVLIVCALIAAGVMAYYAPSIRSQAITAASYGARVACSCRFVGGRPLEDCRKDFMPGMGLVTLSEDSSARSVTARFPLLARQTATYREGWGCVSEAWAGAKGAGAKGAGDPAQ